jgi:uncharacterized protein
MQYTGALHWPQVFTLNTRLTPEEARVLGSLLEKAVTTPDQYPLTLNALVNACNQKSSREPVMSLTSGAVQRTTRQLQDKFLLKTHDNFKSGVEKYEQRFCNTTLSENQLPPPEYAIICLLLLRGPQTAGEIRARSPRLHAFADNHAVVAAFNKLLTGEHGTLIARLPKKSGRQDHEYMHLFFGDIESAAEEAGTIVARAPASNERELRISQLEARVMALETALTRLAEHLGEEIDLNPSTQESETTANDGE